MVFVLIGSSQYKIIYKVMYSSLYMKSKCANFAFVLLDQYDSICTFKKILRTYLFSWKTDISKHVLFWSVDHLYTNNTK